VANIPNSTEVELPSLCNILHQSRLVSIRERPPQKTHSKLPLFACGGILYNSAIPRRRISIMAKQTQLGIGAAAMLALIMYAAPYIGFWAIPLLVLTFGMAVWGFWPLYSRFLPSKNATSDYFRGVAKTVFGFAIILMLGIGLGRVDKYEFWKSWSDTGPIVWNFEDTARGKGYFLDMQKRPGEEIVIAGFGARGKNTTADPITDFDGYLRSDKTNQTLPIYIMAANAAIANACTITIPSLPKDTLGIPALADFAISTSKKPLFVNTSYEGLSLSQFLNEFVPFTIVMEYDGKKHQRHFTREEVDRQVAILEKVAAPSTNPYVIRKSTAPEVNTALPSLSPLIPPNATPVPPDITGKVPDK
jgi:hypothetical protein